MVEPVECCFFGFLALFLAHMVWLHFFVYLGVLQEALPYFALPIQGL